VARKKEKLKLGEGAAFDPTRLEELPQENETWEADFEALPKPPAQNERHFLGMVVSKKGRCILAEMQVSRPSINDMATMLAKAMLSPLSGDAHRPSRIYARYYTPWDDVYPHLKEIGIKVSAHREFPWIYHLFHERLRQMREMRSPGRVEPTEEQAKVADMFPALSKFVQDCGFIEIGDLDGCGFIVTAEDYDGVRVFEDDNLSTLVEAMAALEKELSMWFGEKKSKSTSVIRKGGKNPPPQYAEEDE
jgi:hypothetical protein